MASETDVPFLAQALWGCWPWLLLLAGCLLVLRLLIAWMRIEVRPARVLGLASDEQGGVQTLSFVLTVPLFIFIMMFIVQLSQITIGQIGVEYAAFAAARSAIVWIPAETYEEPAMTIGAGREFKWFEAYSGDRQIQFNVSAYMESPPAHVPAGTTNIYRIYEVIPGGAKYEKIRTAAALALMNVAPSRQVVTSQTTASTMASLLVAPMEKASLGVAPVTATNPRWSARLNNKLAYALESTAIRIRIRHKDSSASALLWDHDLQHDRLQFRMNEVDWQDQVQVDVVHEFALLPGPGRLLSRRADLAAGREPGNLDPNLEPVTRDRIHGAIGERQNQTYTYPLYASARLTVEGFKPQRMIGQPTAATADYWSQTGRSYYTTGVPGAQR